MMDERNPVVILDGNVWHVAENGRSAKVAHCGKQIRNNRAHSRVKAVGWENVCPKCVRRFREDFPETD
jgi:hypothetical protein